MTTAAAPPVARRSPVPRLRVALLAGWVLIVLTAVLAGQRTASLDDLRAAVGTGRVTSIEVAGGLPADAVGASVQTVVWRTGPVTHRTEVWQLSPGVAAPDDTLPVVAGDLVDQLRADRPGLRVRPAEVGMASSTVLGWRVPVWLGVFVLVEGLATLFLLVNGPEPERATRWAWFWLLGTPVGTLAFLLLSGPFPGLPRPRPRARRLTGGWAFLLGGVLASVLPGWS